MFFFMGAWAPEKVSCGCQGGRWAEAAVDTGLGCEAAGSELRDQSCPLRHWAAAAFCARACSQQAEGVLSLEENAYPKQPEGDPRAALPGALLQPGDAHRLPSKSELSRLAAPLCKETRGGKSWWGSGWTRPSRGR